MELSYELHNFLQIYCCNCGNTHVVMQVCKNRYCDHCGHVRRWRSRERLLQVIKGYRRHPGYMLKMLTVSMPNSADLETGIDQLISGFRRLRQSAFWKSHVLGGLFVIEITGQEGSWHPHIHAFIYSKRIPWHDLRDCWKRASRGGMATWIANISDKNAIYYVTKYVTKTSLSAESAQVANGLLQGRRLFQRFGSFTNFDIGKPLFAKDCADCGENIWINEYDIRYLSKSDAHRITGDSLRAVS